MDEKTTERPFKILQTQTLRKQELYYVRFKGECL